MWSLVLIRMIYSQILNTEIEIQGSWLLFDPHHSFRAPDMEGERNEPAWEGSQLDMEVWNAEGLHLSFFPLCILWNGVAELQDEVTGPTASSFTPPPQKRWWFVGFGFGE